MEHQTSPETAPTAAELELERFRFIADSMPHFIWTATPDGQINYYNQQTVRYTGMPLETLLGSGWQESVHPDDLPECIERWMRTITTQCDYELEIRIRRGLDNTYRWHLSRAIPQRNQHGEVIQWVGTCTDIQEQKQRSNELAAGISIRTAELALAHQQLQTILEGATNVSIIATDTAGIITLFNSGAENLLGYRANEMVRKHTPALFHLESEVVARGLELTQQTGYPVEGFEVFVHNARMGRHEEREWTYVRKSGSHFTVTLVVTALRDSAGTITGFLGVALDVTARRRAEAEALANLQHFRLIVETIQDYALLMLDTGGYVVSWNTGAERIKGYKADEIIGQHFSCFYTPEDKLRHHALYELRMAEKHGRYSEEGWRIRKDGSRFWAEVVISAMRDEHGKLLGFAKVVHDITRRKQTEERFQLLVEASPSAMIMVASDARIALVNKRAEKLFGYTRHQLLGKPLEILLPLDVRARHRELMRQYFSHPVSRPMGKGQQLMGRCKDGSEVPVEISLSPIRTSDGLFVLASIVDITERKQVEKTLRDQASILDMASDAIMIRDAEDRITYWNRGAERVYGWSKQQALGQISHELLKTTFPEPLPAIQAKLFESGSWNGELQHTRRDGSLVTVASAWTLQRTDPNYVLELDYDLTSYREAESRLQATSQRLELATSALKAGIWDWEVESGTIHWDAAMREMYGMPPDQAVRYEDWTKAVLPQDLPQAEATLQKVISTCSKDFMEFRIQLPNASIRHIQGAEAALADDSGRVVRVVGLNLDVTDRKHAEAALREQSNIIDLANDAIFIRDNQDRFTFWNQGAQRLYGWTAAEALGQVVHVLFKTRFSIPLAEIKSHLFANGHWSGELEQTTKHGRVITVATAWTLRRDEAGDLQSILCINHDITDQKRADAELMEARLALEARVCELAETNKELARKSEEVEAFVYIVSHDLRAPLVNLQGFSRELEMSCAELQELGTTEANAARTRAILTEDIPDSLHYIAASTTKFNRLINSLLELSRYGRQVYKLEKLSLDSVVRSTLDLMHLSLATSSVQVSVSPLPEVYADHTALGQVFANLVGNAVKYRKPGQPCHIEIGGEVQRNQTHCWVKDNGVGIPAAAKERLFQVFQRFHPTMAEGEGMGLALVRRIVERHGGRIWAEGEEGVGTTFHFTLPRKTKAEEIYV